MRHVLTALVQNRPGVLANISQMFAARGFNIDSLVVGRTEDADLSRMTIVAHGDEQVIEQIRKQLAKIVTVVRVRDFKDEDYVERDLLLMKVACDPSSRSQVVELANLFRGHIVDVSVDLLMIEVSGPEEKLEAFIDLCRPYGIREMARTGVIAMTRGSKRRV